MQHDKSIIYLSRF